MKDSGVEWIGEIPKGWEVSTIGAHYRQRSEKVSDLEFAPLSVTKNGIVPQLDNAAKSANHNDRKLVKKGDFVINSRSDRKMSAGLALEDGSVSLINIALFSEDISEKYTKYLLKNYSFAEEFYRWGTGIVADLWSTKWDSMKRIAIPIPSKKEQIKISNKIKKEVRIIDKIIYNTQQSIEELRNYKQALITEVVSNGLIKNVEMMKSGASWINEIPISWQLIKLKYISNITGRIGYRGYTINDIVDAGEGAVTLSPSNIIDMKINLKEKVTYISWKKYNESIEIQVEKKDIIFCKTGSGYGKSGVVENSDYSMTINPQLVIIRVNKACSKYVNYFFNSLLGKYQIETIVGGSTMPTISQEKLKSVLITLPDIETQKLISKYLDEKISIINYLIKNKKRMIQEYEQYKKSLIYEYVTGKKEV